MEPIATTLELVFIDATVEDYESLVQGSRPEIVPVIINPDEDGIALIARTLSLAQNVEHVHIISHGAPGTIQLGSSILSLNNFSTYVHHLKQWANALANSCELLLYGCNVAAGDRGTRFVQKLASYLNIPVAASTHPVGHAQHKGSWELDYQTGKISASNAIDASTQAMYQGAFIINALYASDNDGDLYVVDIETAEAVDIGDLSFPTFAIARNEANDEGPIIYIGNDLNSDLVSQFNPEDQTNQPVGTTNLGQVFLKLAQAQDGRFYAMTSSTANLFASATPPNPANPGAAVDLGVVANLPIGSGDVAFNPNDENELFVLVTNPGNNLFALYTVDVSAVGPLSAEFVGNITNSSVLLTPGTGSGSLAFGPNGNLYLTSNNPNPSLYRIPVVNGIISVDGNSNIEAEFVGETVDAFNPETALTFTDFATLPITLEQPEASLVVTKTDNRDTITPGEDTLYDIVVTNDSEATIQFLEVIDEVPDLILNPTWTATIPVGGGSFLESGSNSITGTGDIDLIATLDNDVSITITLTGTIDSAAPIGTLLNTTEANTSTGVSVAGTDTTEIIGDDDDCEDGEEIRGNNANNRLVGTPDNDPIFGLGGADELIGLECNDDLFGGRGNDILRGNEDNDTLRGQRGSDILRGGSGADRLNGGFGQDRILGGTQNDVLRGRNGNDSLNGKNGRDRVRGDDGNDRAAGGRGNDRVFGGFGEDTLRGGSGRDIIQAGQNDDKAIGGAGEDLINGGLGADRIFGRIGDDSMRGGRANDVIRAGAGNDSATGNLGDDRIFGSSGNDSFRAQRGNDVVRGAGGDDELFGNQGDDKVIAGAGDDLLLTGLGSDRANGKIGNDILVLGRGDDRGKGNSGNDVILGKVGDDRIGGATGDDRLDGGRGADKVGGGQGQDIVRGSQGADIVNGRAGNDEVRGGLGNDILRGANGADSLIGGRGDDILIGGNGVDTFVFRRIQEGVDRIRDLMEGDRIDLSAIFAMPDFIGSDPFSHIRVRNVSGGSSVVQIDSNGNEVGREFVDLVVLQGINQSAIDSTVFLV